MRQAPKGRQKDESETPVCRPSGARLMDTLLSGVRLRLTPGYRLRAPAGAESAISEIGRRAPRRTGGLK